MRVSEYIRDYKSDYYCEIIIEPNGMIELAHPSHIMKLVELSKESYETLCNKMPINAGPVFWLVEYLNCVAVWYDSYIYCNKITQKQLETLEKLKKANCISKDISGILSKEVEICGIREL